ncbi:hypothetical protein ABT246_25630 [Streptomyces sp. NPDC001553]|uniref:hypothetical protein n=1 Tax=Streptomyces sp. NPDC001553 TaxID=3154385 RepID=UPI003321C406
MTVAFPLPEASGIRRPTAPYLMRLIAPGDGAALEALVREDERAGSRPDHGVRLLERAALAPLLGRQTWVLVEKAGGQVLAVAELGAEYRPARFQPPVLPVRILRIHPAHRKQLPKLLAMWLRDHAARRCGAETVLYQGRDAHLRECLAAEGWAHSVAGLSHQPLPEPALGNLITTAGMSPRGRSHQWWTPTLDANERSAGPGWELACTIRPLNAESDLPGLRELLEARRRWLKARGLDLQGCEEGRFRASPRADGKQASPTGVWIALWRGGIVGAVAVAPSEGPVSSDQSRQRIGAALEITAMCTHPDFQQEEIARVLGWWAVDTAAEAGLRRVRTTATRTLADRWVGQDWCFVREPADGAPPGRQARVIERTALPVPALTTCVRLPRRPNRTVSAEDTR